MLPTKTKYYAFFSVSGGKLIFTAEHLWAHRRKIPPDESEKNFVATSVGKFEKKILKNRTFIFEIVKQIRSNR